MFMALRLCVPQARLCSRLSWVHAIFRCVERTDDIIVLKDAWWCGQR